MHRPSCNRDCVIINIWGGKLCRNMQRHLNEKTRSMIDSGGHQDKGVQCVRWDETSGWCENEGWGTHCTVELIKQHCNWWVTKHRHVRTEWVGGQGQKQLYESVLISALRAANNQFLMTRKKDVKANPICFSFVSDVSPSGDFHIITTTLFRSLICRYTRGTFVCS